MRLRWILVRSQSEKSNDMAATTKVTMLRNAAATANVSLQEGETGEVPSGQAEWLVALGLAVLVDPPKKIKAIPEPAILMAAEPEEAESAAADEKKPPGNLKKSR